MASNLGNYPDNVSDHPQWMNCVYAISGNYGFLPRLLYYATLVFAIFGRRREWLVIGALVSALSYAGTAAIHQMALVSSKSDVYDLDIMGAWAILSTGALAYIAMMHWSSSLRDTDARIILVAWGFLVGTALIFGRTELFDTPLSDPEPACYSSSGKLLIYPLELISPQFNCTYKCFSKRKIMRQANEIMAVPHATLVNKYTNLSVVLVGPIQFAAYAAISWDTQAHTPSGLCVHIVMKHLNPKHKEELVKHIYNASQSTWYGGYFALFHFMMRIKWSWRKGVIAFIALPWFLLGLLVDLFALPFMVINIVLNELSIMETQIPTNEADYAIGQWGPIVSSVLVVLAAIINRYMEMRARAKAIKHALEEDAPAAVESSVFELGEIEEQSVGVVKPSLAHVQTLQDMEEMVKKPKG